MPMRRRPVVLIVEDDDDIGELLIQLVRSEGEYVAQRVATMAAALSSALANTPDVILLDIALPDARGTEGLDCLTSVCPGVPVIMLTANSDERLARETLRRGAFDYIRKPFDADHLARVLEAAIGRAGLSVAAGDAKA